MIRERAHTGAEAVTPEQVRALRDFMNATPESLAATLGVGVREVQAWEAGRLKVPPHEAAWIRRLLAAHARERAAVAAGIGDCAWMLTQDERLRDAVEKGKAAEITRLNDEAGRHAASCPDCIRVREWLETQPPLPPEPPPRGVAGLLAAFLEWAQTLPAWLRPAAYGAALVGGATLLRAVLMLLLRAAEPGVLAQHALLATVVGGAIGAVGGIMWALVHRPLRPLGKAAPYVTGMVICAVCGLAVLAVNTLLAADELSLVAPSSGTALAFLVVLGGPLLGHIVLRHVDDA